MRWSFRHRPEHLHNPPFLLAFLKHIPCCLHGEVLWCKCFAWTGMYSAGFSASRPDCAFPGCCAAAHGDHRARMHFGLPPQMARVDEKLPVREKPRTGMPIMTKMTPWVLAASLLLGISAASGQAPGRALVVNRKTSLVKYNGGDPSEVRRLRPGDLLRTVPTDDAGPVYMRKVILIDQIKNPVVGWVDERNCYHFHPASIDGKIALGSTSLVKELPSRAAGVDPPPASPHSASIPRSGRDDRVEQETEKRVAQTGFVRARLWAMVKNYDAALRDVQHRRQVGEDRSPRSLGLCSILRGSPANP